jgi:hypothetical protein
MRPLPVIALPIPAGCALYFDHTKGTVEVRRIVAGSV